MKSGLLFQCLLLVEMTVPVAAANSLEACGVQLELGTAREPTLRAMAKDKNCLTTKMRDGRWVVSDRPAKRAVAILSFDSNDRLVRVEKNWTPAAGSSADFAGAFFHLVEQAQAAGESACQLTASRRLLMGPNAPLRDPGRPDLNVSELHLVCGQKEFHIYINEPTVASLATKEVFKIPNVLLYESISRHSVKPSNRVSAPNSHGSGSQWPERARNTPDSSGTKRFVRMGAVSN